MIQNDEAIQSFKRYLEDRGKSAGTVAGLTMEIGDVADFLKEREKQLVELRQEDVEAYGNHLLDNGKTAKTVHRRLQNLLIFLRFLKNKKLLDEQAEACITKSKVYIRTLPRPLTVDETKRLILACPDLKQRTLFTFLYETGIRPEEVAKLKKEDINYDDLYVLVHGKEEKPRPVFFNRKLKDLLKKYLRTRKDSLPFLFVDGKVPVTKPRMQVYFMDLARQLELEGHVGVDSLRQSLAAHMLEQGVDLGHVGQLLGTENLDALAMLGPAQKVAHKARGGQFVSALDLL